MKELSNTVSKMFANLYDGDESLYYYTIHVDETDEDRETAKKQWGAICGVNKAFRSLSLFMSEDEAHEAMMKRLKAICETAVSKGYEPVGSIVDEQPEFQEWWAYADFTHNGKPIRIWGQLGGINT